MLCEAPGQNEATSGGSDQDEAGSGMRLVQVSKRRGGLDQDGTGQDGIRPGRYQMVSGQELEVGLVGAAGFEPAASCTQNTRANQAAPRPDEVNLLVAQAQRKAVLAGFTCSDPGSPARPPCKPSTRSSGAS